jgi:16S rRNA (cytosine1402-N4)-methyltransferase
MLKDQKNQKLHVPVLLSSVLTVLEPTKADSYLDLTAGYGGHAEAILQLTKNPKEVVLIDRDETAVDELKKKFKGQGIEVIKSDFYSASQKLVSENRQFDMILADLGVSSPHLNIASRGFSLRQDGPLDMRMDQEQTLTAKTIANSYSESDLANLIKQYGEDPKYRQIARQIVRNRPVNTTSDLANIVARVWPGYHKVHPATRTFQALRIAVNDELEQLKDSLPLWIKLLTPGGRLAVISFHSLEDRAVKHFFKEESGSQYDSNLSLITKHPVTGDKNEIVFNPRARSAKLRAVAKIKINRKGNAHADTGKKQLPNL